jgi:hypothetical protein
VVASGGGRGCPQGRHDIVRVKDLHVGDVDETSLTVGYWLAETGTEVELH